MVFLLVLAGCAQWDTSQTSPSLLRTPAKTPDTVVLQTCFVTGTADPKDEDSRSWREIDEQHLPSELRHRLAANGIRCGIAGQQLPVWLRRLVDERVSPLEASLAGSETEAAVGARQQVIQSRAGRVSRQMVSPKTQETMTVLFNEDGEVHGQMFSRAQGLFSIRTYPQGDGRVRLELTPEIEYGDPHQRWVGQEGMFILDTSRSRKTFERLAIEAFLTPGQTLVVGGLDPPRGLGATFFAEPAERAVRQRLLLVRVAESNCDDLFPGSQGKSSVPDAEPL